MKITVAFEKPTYFRDTYHKLKNKLSDSEDLQCIGPRTVGSVMTNRLLKLPSSSSNWPIPPALGTLPYTPCTPWCPDVTFVDSPMVSIAAQVRTTYTPTAWLEDTFLVETIVFVEENPSRHNFIY